MAPINATKRPLISKWTILFILFTVPFILFYARDTSTPEAKLEKLLERAQQVGGVQWWMRTVLYEKLSKNVSEKIGLEYPGHKHSVQSEALQRLAEIPGEAELKIPVLTNILATTLEPGVFVGACRTLELLGTNASETLPLLLSFIAKPLHPYGRSAPLIAASHVAPQDPSVKPLVTNRVYQIIASNAVSSVQPKLSTRYNWEFGELHSLVDSFYRVGVDSRDLNVLFIHTIGSNRPEMINHVLSGVSFRSDLPESYPPHVISSLLSLWHDMTDPRMKGYTVWTALRAALEAEENHPLALEFYQHSLTHEWIEPVALLRLYDMMARNNGTSILPEATSATADRLIATPNIYEWDAGSWMETFIWTEHTPHPALEPWLFERVLTDVNPRQVKDWGRYVQNYNEPKKALQSAISILRHGNQKKRESLLAELTQGDPGERHRWDDTFLERYDLTHLKSAPSGDLLRARLEDLSALERAALVGELTGEIQKLDTSVAFRNEALERLAKLANLREQASPE